MYRGSNHTDDSTEQPIAAARPAPLFSARIKFLVGAAVSAAALGWTIAALVRIELAAYAVAVRELSVRILGFALVAIILQYTARLYRLRLWIAAVRGGRLSARAWIHLYLKSVALAAITPLRVGDFSRIPLLARCELPLPLRGRLVVLEKLCDFLYLPAALAVTAGELARQFGVPARLLYGAAFVAATIAICVMILIRGELLLAPLFRGVALTGLSFACFLAANILIFASAGSALTPLQVTAIVTAVGILANLPISLNGAGVREAGLLGLLTLYRVAPEQAAVIIVIESLTTLVFPAVLYVLWLAIEQFRNCS